MLVVEPSFCGHLSSKHLLPSKAVGSFWPSLLGHHTPYMLSKHPTRKTSYTPGGLIGSSVSYQSTCHVLHSFPFTQESLSASVTLFSTKALV